MIRIQYLTIVEKAGENYSIYVPDLPGCVATGKTRNEAITSIRDAIELHIQGMLEDHEPIPTPSTSAEYVSVT